MYTRHCTQMCTNNKRLGGKRAYKVETRLYKVQCFVYLKKERCVQSDRSVSLLVFDKNVKKYNFGREFLSNYYSQKC